MRLRRVLVSSTELAWLGTEGLAWAEVLEGACAAFATHFRHVVAPPVEVGFGILQAEEDDDACNGNAAGPCC